MLHSYTSVLKVACCSVCIAAAGMKPGFAEKSTSYFVIEQRVSDFMKELSANTGARIQMSEASRGWIRNTSLSGDLTTILTSLEVPLDMDWFEYNNVYFISQKAEAVTRMVRLGDLEFSDVTEKLQSSNFPIDRFPMREISDGSAIILTGPPRLLAFVEATIESLPKKEANKGVKINRGIMSAEEVIE